MNKLLSQSGSSLERIRDADYDQLRIHPVSMLYQQLALSFKQQSIRAKQQVSLNMPRKTKDEAEQTRQGIMRAALTVFSDKGVSRSSLADIAKEAGVTRGAIYWHFENKSDLMHKMMMHYFDCMDQQVRDEHQDYKGSAMLLRAAESWIDIIESSEELQMLLEISFFKMEHTGDMSALHEIESNLLQADIAQMSNDLQCEIDEGVFRADVNLEEVSIILVSTIHGLLMQWILLKKKFSLRSVMISSITAILDSLRVNK